MYAVNALQRASDLLELGHYSPLTRRHYLQELRFLQKLPAVMSPQEMRRLLAAVTNVKHGMLLSLLYGTGMRLSEIAHLKLCDIDSTQMQIRIVSGNRKKDRLIPLSAHLLQELRAYYLQYRPQVYLFNGAGKGKKYGMRTIQHVMQITLAKAGLKDKNYSVHTVRHSFATHLLDNGADLPSIQQLMGHHDIRQTMRYLHLTTQRLKAIENPYDTLWSKADL